MLSDVVAIDYTVDQTPPVADAHGVDDLLHRLGQRIRDLRSQRGWSQEEFADICRVHRTYMGHLERGEKNVSITSVVRVSGALGITLSELFAGVDGGEQAPRRKPRGRMDMDRTGILKQLAAAERSIQVAQKIASQQVSLQAKRNKP